MASVLQGIKVVDQGTFITGPATGMLLGDLGADYFLSKRIDVYLVATYQKASGTDSTGKEAVASINQLTPSTSNHQTAVRLVLTDGCADRCPASSAQAGACACRRSCAGAVDWRLAVRRS
jgi:hypothetical protein